MAGIGFTYNYNASAGNGLGGQTRIISLSKTNMTQAELNSVIQALTLGGVSGTDDAVTVAGIASDGAGGIFVGGTSDVVYVAVQGTGVLTPGSNYRGVTGVTAALVATFDQTPL